LIRPGKKRRKKITERKEKKKIFWFIIPNWGGS